MINEGRYLGRYLADSFWKYFKVQFVVTAQLILKRVFYGFLSWQSPQLVPTTSYDLPASDSTRDWKSKRKSRQEQRRVIGAASIDIMWRLDLNYHEWSGHRRTSADHPSLIQRFISDGLTKCWISPQDLNLPLSRTSTQMCQQKLLSCGSVLPTRPGSSLATIRIAGVAKEEWDDKISNTFQSHSCYLLFHIKLFKFILFPAFSICFFAANRCK